MQRSLQRNDRAAQMETYGSVGTLHSIVGRLAEATSQFDWHLYHQQIDQRRNYGPAGDDRREVVRHQALSIWNKPNEFMTGQEFREISQQHLDLAGEAWWLVERFDGTTLPSGLWPIRPDRMEPVPHPTDFLSGYIYRSPDGEQIPLDLDEVIFLRTPSPLDPYRGMSPVQSIFTDLESSTLASAYNRNFFLNSAAPGGVIEVPDALSDVEYRELRDRWREQHQGVAQAHRVAILERGVWKDRTYTMKDMQFAELRNVSREAIREAYSFPKPMTGAVDDINRANAEAGEVVFGRWHIQPRLERIKQALNNDFLPLFGSAGQGREFDFDSPIPEDQAAEASERTSKTQAANTLVTAGYHPEDVLTTVGLPPMRFVGKPTTPEPAEGGDDGPEPTEDEPADSEAA